MAVEIINPRARLFAEALLVLSMMLWGTTFVIVQETIRTVPVHWFHTLRFTLGAAALWTPLLVAGRGSEVNRRALAAGAIMGVGLFGIFAFQTIGLLTTTASKSAFITATSVLMVPALAVCAFHRRFDPRALVSGCIGLVGLYLLLMDHGWGSFHPDGMAVGDVYTLLCAACIAVHLLLTKHFSPRFDTMVLTAVQLTVVAVFSLGFSFAWDETRIFGYGWRVYAAIAFLGLVTSALNIWILTHMQRYTTPQRTAVIFLVEPLFAAATAWVVQGTALNSVQWIGAVLILGGMVILECLPERKTRWTRHPAAP